MVMPYMVIWRYSVDLGCIRRSMSETQPVLDIVNVSSSDVIDGGVTGQGVILMMVKTCRTVIAGYKTSCDRNVQ